MALVVAAAGAAPAWAVDRPEVEQAARDVGLARVAPAVAASAADTIRVRRAVVGRAPAQVGVTRLGGAPDLPADEPWPRCRRRPMTFLGQVRGPEAGLGPGLVAFFTQVAPGSLWAGDCSAVLRFDPAMRLRRRAAPRIGRPLVLRPASVGFVPAVSLPAVSAGGALSATERDAYALLREDLGGRPGGTRLLGFPDPAPLDPREQCVADQGGTVDEWQLVLQLDRDRPLGFDADGGRLSILARAGRLDRVCSVFDR